MLKRLLILLFVFFSTLLFAQVEENPDSSNIYKKLQKFSEKRKFTYMLYTSVFRPITPLPEPVAASSVHAETKPVYFTKYEGKFVRNIRIETFDPFGYDPRDTSTTPLSFFQKAGNQIHIKTLPFKVKNILLIKKGEKFDSLRVKESERLIRLQSAVREVFVTPELTNSDSVDIHIRVYDTWSVIGTGIFSTSSVVINLKDKNFLGLGHQFSNRYGQDFSGTNTYEGNYYVPNISNTFITSNINYSIDENKNYRQGINVDRPFYSIFARYAFGASFLQQVSRTEMVSLSDSSNFIQKYVSNTQDYWFGKSWQIARGKAEQDRALLLISSVRYYRLKYLDRAPAEYDTLQLRSNEDIFLYSIGITKRIYKEDNYIFNYGYIEDVPTGFAFNIVGGYQVRDDSKRFYIGSKIYLANYHPWGYFNNYIEYGTFMNGEKPEEGNVTAGINYFSNMLRFGKWKIRQFAKTELTLGYNRRRSDNLSINNESGIRGFNGEGLTGVHKATLTLQLQSYAPWNILGFRFGPFLVASFGMLGNEQRGFSRAPVYSSLGLGLLIKNEYLVLNTFQVSIAFYPRIPGVGEYIFKPNPFKTSDFGFRGFDISKPSTVSYN